MAKELKKKEIDDVLEKLIDLGVIEDKNYTYSKCLIKKLASSNTHPDNRISASSNQTHIAITSNEMDVFPFITNRAYILDPSNGKPYMTAPIEIQGENLEYLDKNNTYSDIDSEFTIYNRTGRYSGQADQIQLSKFSDDGPDFLELRKLLEEDDYLIFLTDNNMSEYEVIGVRNNIHIKTGVYSR